ncbi:MAG: spike base protein, RCAP_Rcc01079 family [Pikeienuella sp.]
MAEKFLHHSTGLSAPCTACFEFTQHATNTVEQPPRVIIAEAECAATVIQMDGSEHTFNKLLAGVPYPVRILGVKSTVPANTAIEGWF